MSLVPPTASRVPEHTAAHINRQIEREIEASVTYFAEHPDEIDDRLEDLDREWDIERTLEANAATFSLLGLTLAMTVDRRWLALPVGVATFLLQHAVQGWCPPVPVFRRFGVRTASEIDRGVMASSSCGAISTRPGRPMAARRSASVGRWRPSRRERRRPPSAAGGCGPVGLVRCRRSTTIRGDGISRALIGSGPAERR